MKFLIVCAVLFASSANAAMYIFTPGQPAKMVTQNGNGYTVVDIGDGSMTQVLDMGGVTTITGGGRPTSFIMDGGELGRSMDGVVPALNPATGDVAPQLNLRPEGIDVNFEEWR